MVCKCPMCDREFGQRRYMYEHVKTVHSKWEHVKVRRTKIEKTDKKCKECGFAYADSHGADGYMCRKNQAGFQIDALSSASDWLVFKEHQFDRLSASSYYL